MRSRSHALQSLHLVSSAAGAAGAAGSESDDDDEEDASSDDESGADEAALPAALPLDATEPRLAVEVGDAAAAAALNVETVSP